MPSPAVRKSGYLPGLDGLRAFAILGVMMTHDLPWTIAGHSNAKWKGYGGWGVQLFFAISGVLICWRLLEDEAKAGHISLGSFYVRRLLRIQPAAFAYLGVIALLFAIGAIPVNWTYWWSGVLSYTNFLINVHTAPGAAAFLGHYWTLAVEEHFYILISLVFLAPRRYRTGILVFLLAALYIGQRYAEYRGLYVPAISERRTYWIIQFLLAPALLVLLIRGSSWFRSLIERYGKPWVATTLIIALMMLHLWRHGTQLFLQQMRHFSIVSFLSRNLDLLFYGFGLWVLAIMLHPRSWSTRFLELRPLRFVGRLSYSIYLWHILFFIPVYLPTMIHAKVLLLLSERPWKYILTAIVALLSYYFIEKPLIRLGHKLAPPATAGHKDLNVQPEMVPHSFPAPAAPATADLAHGSPRTALR